MIKFSGVSDLQGVKVPIFLLTLLVIVTTVLRYRAACDKIVSCLQLQLYSRYWAANVVASGFNGHDLITMLSGVT